MQASHGVRPATRVLLFGPFEVRPADGAVLKDGRPCRLGARATEILLCLLDRPGALVTNAELMARVWPNTVVLEANLRVHMTALRRALGDDGGGQGRIIANLHGRGYRFIAPVTAVDRSAGRPAPSPEPRPAEGAGADASPGTALPVFLTALIGREAVIGEVTQALAGHRLVTVVGPGGIGKTRVAVAAAAAAENQGHGVGFVDLAEQTDVASLTGMAGGRPAAGRRLLVLDNCEHRLDEVVPLVETRLRELPGLRILATSREPLRAEGERLFRLSPLSVPAEWQMPLTAAEALEFPAIRLFAERAAAAMPRFCLAETVPVVAGICRDLDGIPLAIELAAQRLDTVPLRLLAVALQSRFALGMEGRRTAPPRHRSLRDALDWSFCRLPACEQAFLAGLATLPIAFTRDMAVAAAGGSLDDGEASRILEALVAKSLVAVEPGEGPACYRLFRTTQSYALEQAGSPAAAG